MKTLLYISMLITVIFSSQGISLYKHLCGGELIRLEIYHSQEKSGCTDQQEPCDKCEDQEAILSLDDFNIKNSTLVFALSEIEAIGFVEYVIRKIGVHTINNNLSTPLNSPPNQSGKQISILYQSFLL